MEISEVRIKLVPNSTERLRAFCSVTFNGDFVIRDLKIIEGLSGPFVAMPSRKLADRCPRCGAKNHLRAKFCNECGLRLRENRAPKDVQGRAKLHADIAHPINAGCRERIQHAVIEAYHAELDRSKSPDYRPPKFDDFDEYEADVQSESAVSGESTPATHGAKSDEVQSNVADAQFGDYNDLIADLKRDAAGRRDRPDGDVDTASKESSAQFNEEDDRSSASPDSPRRQSVAPAPRRSEPASTGSARSSSDETFGEGLT